MDRARGIQQSREVQCPYCLTDNYFVPSHVCHKRSDEEGHVCSAPGSGLQLWEDDGAKGERMWALWPPGGQLLFPVEQTPRPCK